MQEQARAEADRLRTAGVEALTEQREEVARERAENERMRAAAANMARTQRAAAAAAEASRLEAVEQSRAQAAELQALVMQQAAAIEELRAGQAIAAAAANASGGYEDAEGNGEGDDDDYSGIDVSAIAEAVREKAERLGSRPGVFSAGAEKASKLRETRKAMKRMLIVVEEQCEGLRALRSEGGVHG